MVNVRNEIDERPALKLIGIILVSLLVVALVVAVVATFAYFLSPPARKWMDENILMTEQDDVEEAMSHASDEQILAEMMNHQKSACSEDLMPKSNMKDPDWAKDFHKQDTMLLQRNYIDANTNPENFQVTRSVCGRRFMSRDLRRVPTITRDPATISSFNLPVIDPVCAKQYNEMKGNLDYDCDTQEWVEDGNSLSALGYPLPKNPKFKPAN